jgi:hypothetical protein
VAVLVEALLIVRRVIREQLGILHRRVLAIVSPGPCRRAERRRGGWSKMSDELLAREREPIGARAGEPPFSRSINSPPAPISVRVDGSFVRACANHSSANLRSSAAPL